MEAQNTPESTRRWLAATEPLRSAVIDLIEGYPDEMTLPDAASDAMTDLVQEEKWLSPDPNLTGWTKEPIRVAHSLAALQYRLAMDCAAAVEHLIKSTDPPSIYAPTALVRPVLEGAARSHWLSETGIGTGERLRRAVNDRIDNLYRQTQGPTQDAQRRARERLGQIRRAAVLLGYEVAPSRKSRMRFLEPTRPSTTAVIRTLFGQFDSDPGLPKALMIWASSATHAGALALTAYAEHIPSGPLQPYDRAQLRLTDRDANTLLASVVMALVLAGRTRLSFNGWAHQIWLDRAKAGFETVRKTMANYGSLADD